MSTDHELVGLQQLREDLDKDPSEFPLSELRPVLIPSPILASGGWPGPFHYFAELPVSLAWAFLRPHQTMLYLSGNAADRFASQGVDWRSRAREALVSDFDQRPWTHEFKNDGGKLEAVALLHEDGLGPSRLLCWDRLLNYFDDGFTFFVPERSSALVMSERASEKIRESVRKAVVGCLKAADVPMSSEPFHHDVLRMALERARECA